ncbi:MAG TPA: kelch repeat-containing protein [Bryobacteraceae bacterium]|nr:kelch repeat-containing protein [Bryobacteraceae bacterium]
MVRSSRLVLFVTLFALSGFILLLVGQALLVPSGQFATDTALSAARDGASAATLSDGRVLVSGGNDASGNPLATAEFLGAGASAGTMTAPRSGHISVALKDGTVLLAGGITTGGAVTNSAEIFNPSTGLSTAIASLLVARSGATATLLSDGRVFIAGGQGSGSALQTTEIYDPATGQFTNGAPLSAMRQNHAAALLNDGRVAIAGGSDGANGLNTIDIYDPAANSVSPFAAPMAAARSGLSATTLMKGQVLLAGGTTSGNPAATTEILDVTAGTITPGPAMSVARSSHLALLLPNNNTVLMVSGTSASAAAEIYIPWQNAFAAFGTLANPRTDAAGGASGQTGAASVAGGLAGGTASAVVETIHFPMVRTDKPDYQPGDTATITGSGFAPNETVNVIIEEVVDIDNDSPITLTPAPQADANGSFSAQFPINVADLNIRFYLNATGQTSGLTAGMTFTDKKAHTVTVASPTSVTVDAGATAVYGTVTVSFNGSAGSCTVTLAAAGLPAGATAVFGMNTLTSTGSDVTTSFSVTTTAATVPGTYTPINVTATDGTGCDDAKTQTSNNLTLIVNAPAATTFTNLTASQSITYGMASVTLSGKLTSTPTNPPIGSGVAITINGVTTNTTTTDAAGDFSTSVTTSALNASATPYTITYSYAGGGGFASTSDTSTTLTVNKATPTITFGAAPTPTYLGGNFTVTAITNSDGALSFGYVSGPCAVVSAAAGTFSSSGAGTCVVSASTPATTNFLAGSASPNLSVAIAKATPTLSVTNSPQTYTGSGQSATVSASVAGVVSNILTGGAATQTNANTYAVTANFVPNDTTDYNTLTGASAGNFVIKQAPSMVTVTCPAAPQPFTGSAQTPCTALATGVGGLSVSLPSSAFVYSNNTHVGTATVIATYSGDINHTGSYNSGSFTISQATTSTLYTGGQIVVIPNTFILSATVSSSAGIACAAGTLSYSLDLNPITQGPGPYPIGPSPQGTTGWMDGVYTITVTFTPNDATDCIGSFDTATLTVAVPGDSATGGGWYTLSGNGRINFGFVVNKVPNTSPAKYKGQLVLINNGKWRLKGTLNTYSSILSKTGNQGAASGTGTLYYWDSTLNGGLGDWAVAQTGVTFTASFTDNGQGGKNSLDAFGIHIDHVVVSPPEPSSLPNSSPIQLKGGNITVN